MKRAGPSYVMALLWVAAFAALTVSVSLVAELVLVDFVHGNPNRPQSNALTMMALYPPIFSIVILAGVWIVFGPAQLLQGVVTSLLPPNNRRLALSIVVMMLPVTGTLTWYSYDYLTPSDFNLGINEGTDWSPYQHGISPLRLIKAMAAQAIVTVFTLAYCNAGYLQLSQATGL